MFYKKPTYALQSVEQCVHAKYFSCFIRIEGN